MIIVNKVELADILRWSVKTLNAAMDRYPGFPVLVAGDRGIEWQFDAEAAVQFITDRRQ